MGKNYDFDYIVIGSGPAGRTVATKLAESKKQVAIVEYQAIGGAEVNTRDLPYKLALDFARNYYNFASSPAVNSSSCHFNFPTMISHQNSVISNVSQDYATKLNKANVKIISGFAHFIDSHTIAVDETKYTAKNFILATGSELKANEISGLDSVGFLRPDNAIFIKRLPQFVFVVGGGPTGVQIAEYFAMLGVGVIIMERGSHLLPREDEEVAKAITDYFTNELNITVIPNSKVISITEDFDSKIVVFTNGEGEKMVRVDSIVLTTGSTPSLDYGLENAGVDYKRSGITVNKYFETSAKNIFAIGDCIDDTDSSTERATVQANILANNLLHRQKFTAKYSGIARKINLHPEIAVIGMNERDTLSHDLKCRKSIIYLKDLPSLNLPEYQYGFVKLLANHSNHLIGATIVAPNAKALINELSLVLANKLSIENLATTPHSSDTAALAISLAAKKLLTK